MWLGKEEGDCEMAFELFRGISEVARRVYKETYYRYFSVHIKDDDGDLLEDLIGPSLITNAIAERNPRLWGNEDLHLGPLTEPWSDRDRRVSITCSGALGSTGSGRCRSSFCLETWICLPQSSAERSHSLHSLSCSRP